ncbi:phospholipase C type enzyme [Cytospora paraplurivora]|uniref:Phospholipase C type enzyme n=1 Tax=Cytospora paraplurivora TaxID=2898453 RepID=A0AAN9UEQ2_9PEZI
MDNPPPPPPPPPPSQINITTLNCWGLKFNISKLRQPRLRQIAHLLTTQSPTPDIVCLQEIWAHADYLAVRHATRAALPHGKFYFSGAFGGGLAILSRWPIEESSMVPYVLGGRPTAFWRGDWYVGKGVACARVRIGGGGGGGGGGEGGGEGDGGGGEVIEVFNTHTHAPYSSDRGDTYRVHREAEAWQLAKLLRGAAERGHLVVVAGDFNMTPLSVAHRVVTGGGAPVRDVWRVLHPDSSLGAAEDEVERARGRGVPSAELNVLVNGVTSNSVFNTWRWSKAEQKRLGGGGPAIEVDPGAADPKGKRLDYIFANTAARDLGGGVVGGWVVRDARVGMMQRHPELGCSLSDHFSVEATLVFHTVATTTTNSGVQDALPRLKWPLPPGAQSSLSAFRNSTVPATLHTTTTTTDDSVYDNNSTKREDEGDAPEATSPAGGAFLQLQTSTPSSNRTSFSQDQDQDRGDNNPHHLRSAAAIDPDTQLLSSLPITHQPSSQLTISDYDILLFSLSGYQAREARQTRYRALHFLAWVVVTIGCYAAVWFIPTHSESLTAAQNHATNFVLLLLGSLGLAAGCLDGLMALLFFRGSEERALREYEWELRNRRSLVAGEASGATEEHIGASK